MSWERVGRGPSRGGSAHTRRSTEDLRSSGARVRVREPRLTSENRYKSAAGRQKRTGKRAAGLCDWRVARGRLTGGVVVVVADGAEGEEGEVGDGDGDGDGDGLPRRA
jgi:hypothetical protein